MGVAVAGALLAATSFGLATATTAAATTTQVVAGPVSQPGQPSRATCPSGTHLIGGGYHWQPVYTYGGSPADTVDTNTPSEADQKSWVAKAHNGTIQAYAICETNS
ncbi:hypothetical protein [Kitasatospora sp. SUK 42]|uniref:hypothetical protein n=1 Tax=Kitasatospora sp. SUK 42 TaxID=1588882 RepID=UPI001C31BC50|nr:hypothetical protein [Kitasatospora sp. SUK 42]MBV2155618.1 hypothetical protein [Kitasatospora sp. SUK 42]